MMVSPRWMPRPMPNGAPSASSCLDQRHRRQRLRHRARTGTPCSKLSVCRSAARGCVKASRESTQASSGMLPLEVRVSLPPMVTPHRPAVDRVGRAERRHRQLALLQVLELLLALEGLVAHRREHLQFRRQRAQRDFEAHLVVAGGRAAVRDRVSVPSLRAMQRDGLRLHDALGARRTAGTAGRGARCP